MACVRIVGVYTGRVDNAVDESPFLTWSPSKRMTRNLVGFGTEKVLDRHRDDDHAANCTSIRECFVAPEARTCTSASLEFDAVLLIPPVRKS